ncbi:hypothetical protein [Alkalihalobacillus sp. CinArs1]|uniref:hypothetical protein n=1 Tax=Alkalihalobacillus sp. CinArs1 TaxID=2995314 RepID=UPI0022DE3070|nr:hypothetical protein [Alkalihalobacillus sp. CinArs1]
MEYPGELNLISVFEALPERNDETDDLYNDKSTFSFENKHEAFEVIISPFYQKFSLSVKDKKTTNVLSYIEFHSVKKLEIVEDRKDSSIIRLIHGASERFENIIEITLKPKYKFIFREQFR